MLLCLCSFSYHNPQTNNLLFRCYFPFLTVCMWIQSIFIIAPLFHFSISLSHLFLLNISPQFTSALVLSFLSFLFLSASLRLHPYITSPPDKWGHCLDASSGASRARLQRAQSVKRHQSPFHHSPVLSLFFFFLYICSSLAQLCKRLSESQFQIWWLTSLFGHHVCIYRYSVCVSLRGFFWRGFFCGWEAECHL